MQKKTLFNLFSCYKNDKISIDDEYISSVYSNFEFQYLSFENNESKDESTNKFNNLLNDLKELNFLTFDILDNDNHSNKNKKISNNNQPQIIDVVICWEGKCQIVENIQYSLFSSLIGQVKQEHCNVLNISNIRIDDKQTDEENQAKAEIDSLYVRFNYYIKKNKFVKLTIRSIACYTIRRFFYPFHYFKDMSFFEDTEMCFNENRYKNDLTKYFLKNKNSTSNFDVMEKILNFDIGFVKMQGQPDVYIKEDDIIILRLLFPDSDASFHLITLIDIPGCLFMMKKIEKKNFDYEIEFCKNYSHRCFVPFLGFIKKNEEITGFVYKFMCNGSLESFISKNKEKVTDAFCLMTINRLLQGLEYLKSNSLIHTNLRPYCILLDNNFVPFIFDFKSIRHPIENSDSSTNSKSIDIVSNFYIYMPPEIYNGKYIYSFGKIIYYLFEKQITKIKSMKHASENIQYLFKKDQYKRIKLQEIKDIFIKELGSIDYLKNCFSAKLSNIKYLQATQYIFESITILINEHKKLEKFIVNLFEFLYSNVDKNAENDSIYYLRLSELYYQSNFYILNYEEVIENLKKSAELGNSNAFMKLGIIFEIGQGVMQDYIKAKEFYEKAFELGNSDALVNLGELYENGLGVPQNYANAIYCYNKSSEKKLNSNALNNLGRLCENGLGVVQNYKLALDYYQLSAQLNNTAALNNLGRLYEKGIGVQKNIHLAREYYRKSNYLDDIKGSIKYREFYHEHNNIEYYEELANKNDPFGFNKLGKFYEEGNGVKKDIKKAIEFYEKAIHLKDPNGFINMGKLYEKGIGVKQDYIKARKFYEQAFQINQIDGLSNIGYLYEKGFGVKQDYEKARDFYETSICYSDYYLDNVGRLYENGFGVKQNYEKAFKCYELAAKCKNADAINSLGKLYENGFGVRKNYSQAKDYYEIAAQLGSTDALINLGNLYENGQGVLANYSKAKELYEEAANKNNSEALICLGLLYQFGLGVPRNIKKAYELYVKSIEQYNSNGYVILGKLYEYGIYDKQDYSKANEYYEKAAQQNNSDGLFNLGYLYKNGIGVKKSNSKAKEYFELSAKQNNIDAVLCLGNIYEEGYDMPKDFKKAKECYKSLSIKNDTDALFCLGKLYLNGKGVKKNYLKAKKYFELSSKQSNSEAFLELGNLYFHGNGVEKNDQIAEYYYRLSAQLENHEALFILGIIYLKNKKIILDAIKFFDALARLLNPDAFFYLGYIFYTGEFIKSNVTKAILYYDNCCRIKNQNIKIYNKMHGYYLTRYKQNNYRYYALNDLGLIYLTSFYDIEKARQLIKEATEYPIAQNNYGLINQFFYPYNIDEAKYRYNRIIQKRNFSLAFYNLGYLKEEENKINESIGFYLKASDFEDEPLIYNNINHYDKRYEISKTFILCYTNLKIAKHYFIMEQYNESKKFFKKLFAKIKLDDNSYKFKAYFKKENPKSLFSYLKSFILNFPLFNLKNQAELKLQSDLFENKIKPEQHEIKFEIKEDAEFDDKIKKLDLIKSEKLTNSIDSEKVKFTMFFNYFDKKDKNVDDIISVFENPVDLFEIALSNENLKNIFIDEMN